MSLSSHGGDPDRCEHAKVLFGNSLSARGDLVPVLVIIFALLLISSFQRLKTISGSAVCMLLGLVVDELSLIKKAILVGISGAKASVKLFHLLSLGSSILLFHSISLLLSMIFFNYLFDHLDEGFKQISLLLSGYRETFHKL